MHYLDGVQWRAGLGHDLVQAFTNCARRIVRCRSKFEDAEVSVSFKNKISERAHGVHTDAYAALPSVDFLFHVGSRFSYTVKQYHRALIVDKKVVTGLYKPRSSLA